MSSDEHLVRLRERLGDGGEDVIDRWLDATRARCWQLRVSKHGDQLRQRCQACLRSLTQALHEAESVALGDPIFREPIQHVSFLAGWMAGVDLPVSAAVGLCQGLRDLTGEAGSFYDWLVVVVAEAYAAGVEQAADARHRQLIQKSQVVCILRDRVVGLFLVGDPDREALDDAIGRLMMLAVMRDASTIVLDAAGLADVEERMTLAVSHVAEHRQALATRTVLLSGVSEPFAEALAQRVDLPLRGYERLDFALDSL
ncbi:MAG: hypothetical protein CSA65_04350 [Proteobacteria bacterium]|nr:MAG: hypothetical protein CSA65_04350 [Pseudomonadota bacterium]